MPDLGPHVFNQVLGTGFLKPGYFHELSVDFPLSSPSLSVGVCYAISRISGMLDPVVNRALGDFLGINVLQKYVLIKIRVYISTNFEWTA